MGDWYLQDVVCSRTCSSADNKRCRHSRARELVAQGVERSSSDTPDRDRRPFLPSYRAQPDGLPVACQRGLSADDARYFGADKGSRVVAATTSLRLNSRTPTITIRADRQYRRVPRVEPPDPRGVPEYGRRDQAGPACINNVRDNVVPEATPDLPSVIVTFPEHLTVGPARQMRDEGRRARPGRSIPPSGG